MPTMAPKFIVNAPAEIVWRFLSNMKKLGSCIPGCSVDFIDVIHSNWVMTVKVGPIEQHIHMSSVVTELSNKKRHVKFYCTGDMVEMHGTCDVAIVDEHRSEVDFNLNLQAKGLLAGPLDTAMDLVLPEYERDFVDSVRKALEKHPHSVH